MNDPTPRPGWRSWLPLVPPFLVGAVLRLWNLSGQIAGGDELHAVRAALSRPLSEILFRYEAPDLYMPLAAGLELLSAAGLTITEFWLRLPGMAAGLLALLVLPRLATRFVGARSALLFAWLLALSPGLVLYSRIARSYLPLILLGTTATLAFFAWYQQGEKRHLGLYLCGALGAVFFHPVAGPAVVAPLGYALLDLASRSQEERRIHARRALVAGSGLTLGLGLWFWASRTSLLALVANRREPLDFDWESFWGLAQLQAGATRPLVTLVFWVGVAIGGILLARRERRFALYLGALYLGPIVGLVGLSPVAGDQPLLFNRYTLLALPPLLLFAAEALSGALLSSRRALGKAAVLPLGLMLGLWLALGPLARFQFRSGSFAHHNDFVDFGCTPASLESSELPEVYRRLARSEPPGALIEAPWQPAWRFTRSLHAYQQHHRRRVLVASSEPWLEPSRARLGGLLATYQAAWLASDARFLLVHRDPAREEGRLQVTDCARRAGAMPPALAARLAEQGEALAARLNREWGPPQFADQELADGPILVWDLERVRARSAASSPNR